MLLGWAQIDKETGKETDQQPHYGYAYPFG